MSFRELPLQHPRFGEPFRAGGADPSIAPASHALLCSYENSSRPPVSPFRCLPVGGFEINWKFGDRSVDHEGDEPTYFNSTTQRGCADGSSKHCDLRDEGRVKCTPAENENPPEEFLLERAKLPAAGFYERKYYFEVNRGGNTVIRLPSFYQRRERIVKRERGGGRGVDSPRESLELLTSLARSSDPEQIYGLTVERAVQPGNSSLYLSTPR